MIVALTSEGKLWYESEPVSTIKFPRMRFANPIRVAVFIFGDAPSAGSTQNDDPNLAGPRVRAPGAQRYVEHGNDAPECLGSDVKHSAEMWFENITEAQCPREVRRQIARLHVNLGHPRTGDMVRYLLLNGAKTSSVIGANALKCASCLRTKEPPPGPPSTIPKAIQFNDRLAIDIFYANTYAGICLMFLGIFDKATWYHVVTRLANRNSQTVFDALNVVWLQAFGVPLLIICDQDGSFDGKFSDSLSMLGIQRLAVPSTAHYELGDIERNNAVWREIFNKTVDSMQAISNQQIDIVVCSTNNAKNKSMRRGGRSPEQNVFGRVPRLPDMLLSDEAMASSSLENSSQQMDYSAAARTEALKSTAEVEGSTHLRRAILRKARPIRIENYQPGMKVGFWRDTNTASNARRGAGRDGLRAKGKPGYLIGTYAGQQPRELGKNAMVQYGGRIFLVNPEALRPAVGFEQWVPTPDDIAELRRAEEAIKRQDFVDISQDRPPPDDQPMETEARMDVLDPSTGAPVDDVRMETPAAAEPAAPEVESPAPDEQAPPPPPPSMPENRDVHEEEHRPGEEQPDHCALPPTMPTEPAAEVHNHPFEIAAPEPTQQLAIHSHSSPATQYSPIEPSIDDLEDVTFDTPTMERSEPSMDPLLDASTIPPHSAEEESPHALALDAPAPDSIRQQRDRTLTPLGDSYEVPQPPHKKPRDTPVFFVNALNDLELLDSDDEGFDGCDAVPLEFFVHSFETHPDVSIEEHHSTADVPRDAYMTWVDEQSWLNPEAQPSYGVLLSRAEQKALDREIPWREIMQRGASVIAAFGEAVNKEWVNWCSFQPIKPLTDDQVVAIMADPRLKRRVLKARAAYRDKACGHGPLSAKCRVVLLGCCDPDLQSLFRNSPVGTRTSFYCLLTFCAAGHRDQRGRWKLANADVKSAFLQGRPAPRREKLYMKSPRDPIINAMHAWPADFYEVTGNIYGLANASWTFCSEVSKRMTDRGFAAHSLDPMLFMHRTQGELDCLVLFHVDDALLTWSDSFNSETIKTMFEWGEWRALNHAGVTSLTFTGREIRQDSAGVIRVNQTKFILSTAQGEYDTSLVLESELIGQAKTEFRSCVGSLQYLAGSTRPDLCAPTSLSQRSGVTGKELQQVYEAVEFARETADTAITIPPVDLSNAMIVAYGDSSFAYADQCKTQVGVLIVISERRCLFQETPCALVDWRSCRTARVVRPTLAAEAIASDTGCDHGLYIAAILSEVRDGQSVVKNHKASDESHRSPIQVKSITDCRSLFDALQKVAPSISEKRTLIDVLSIRESIGTDGVLWNPTDKQLADALTKIDYGLALSLLSWLGRPLICLRQVQPSSSNEAEGPSEVWFTDKELSTQPGMAVTNASACQTI